MRTDLIKSEQTAGTFLLSGGTLWILAMIISEALYTGYSIKNNYISDLGTGPWPSDIIFNISTIVFGLLVLCGSLILIREKPKTTFLYGLAIAGVGVLFVGIFPENTGIIHYISAGTAFLIGSLSAIDASRWVKRPFGIFSATMGIIGIFALVALQTGILLCISPGGTERLIAYPLALWIMSYGGYLMNEDTKTKGEQDA